MLSLIEMPPSLASDLGVPSIIQIVYTHISQKSRYHRNYELRLWPKEILAHPPTCAPPLNKLAGYPMPRSLGRLGEKLPVSSSPVAKELVDRRVFLDHCLCGLVSCPAAQVAHRGCARPDWAHLARRFVLKDPNKFNGRPAFALTLTALPSPLPKDRTIRTCRIRLKTTTRNQDP